MRKSASAPSIIASTDAWGNEVKRYKGARRPKQLQSPKSVSMIPGRQDKDKPKTSADADLTPPPPPNPSRWCAVCVGLSTGNLQQVLPRVTKRAPVNFDKGGSDFRCPHDASSIGKQVTSRW
jgi:hypothetical protein